MSSKIKLQHQLETGEIATRTTARDYTHVVVTDGSASDYMSEAELRERYAYLEDPERINGTVADALERQSTEPGVLSWHGSEALATKAAASAADKGYRRVRVEAINGGTR